MNDRMLTASELVAAASPELARSGEVYARLISMALEAHRGQAALRLFTQVSVGHVASTRRRRLK